MYVRLVQNECKPLMLKELISFYNGVDPSNHNVRILVVQLLSFLCYDSALGNYRLNSFSRRIRAFILESNKVVFFFPFLFSLSLYFFPPELENI